MLGSLVLSKAATTLTCASIEAMTEEDALTTLSQMRWPETNGQPFCPHCGHVRSYAIVRPSGFPYFRCALASCRKDYSVFSGTIFSSPKKSPLFYVKAIALFLQFKGDIRIAKAAEILSVNYRTAWAIYDAIRKDASKAYKEAARLDGYRAAGDQGDPPE